MNIFKEILTLWRAEDLLSQAWKDSYEMLNLSKEMFIQSIKVLQKNENRSTIKALKKRDKEINSYEADVRRKILTHYSVRKDPNDIVSGLVLVNIVVDIERVGDYCKNILDLAINYPNKINSVKIIDKLKAVEDEVFKRFDETLQVIHTQDTNVAQKILQGYDKKMSRKSDSIVNKIISGKLKFGSEEKTATIALYSRYLKRVGSHLGNITEIIAYPFNAQDSK